MERLAFTAKRFTHFLQGKRVKDRVNEGGARLVKGTGKWQGIQGKGSWLSYAVAADRVYSDVEWDVEWPK